VVDHLYGDDADLYTILQITPDVEEEAIRQAYRRLAREYHPDVAGDASAEMMKRINAAYRVLSDPAKRREYDLRHGYHRVRPAAPPPVQSRTPSRPAPQRHPSRPLNAVPRPPAAPPTPTRSTGPFHLMRRISGGDSAVASVAFAQSDNLLGVGYSDGRVDLWHLASQQRLMTLDVRAHDGMGTRPGVLQELRLSPNGRLAMAWGLNLGTWVWSTLSGQVLWSSAVNAPSGTMDGVLFDAQPMVRLPLPAAPLAQAGEDPFHWAEQGRMGTDILTRPLEVETPVSPAWSVPMRCEEPTVPRAANKQGRVHMRLLAQDGDALLTFSTGPASATITNASIFHWWNLRAQGRLGASGPQRQGSVVMPGRALWYPIAASARVDIVAAQFEDRAIRVYNLHSGQHVEVPAGNGSPEAHMALSGDGSLLALMSTDMRRIDLWSTARGLPVQTWDLSVPATAIQFSALGSPPTLTIGRGDGSCEVWAAG